MSAESSSEVEELKPRRCGPGYLTPLDAMKGPREKIMYVTCAQPYPKCSKVPDYLATVDVDPNSPTYSQVIHRLCVTNIGDEVHHTGWNVCSSCHGKPLCRDRLLMPCLNSDRIYVCDMRKNPRAPTIQKVIEGSVLRETFDISAPHTTHCLASGEIMISTMGDGQGNGKGSFILLDGKTFEPIGIWERDTQDGILGYDFWYQPRFNIMISTEWGPPNEFKRGFDPTQVSQYGHHLNLWNWKERTLLKRIDLGDDGYMPLEVRFAHDPSKSYGFVGCALSSTVFKFSLENGDWTVKKVISVPAIEVQYWILPEMPGIITDILMSLDDKYLYFSNWVQGDIRQYDVTDPDNPVLTGQIYLGGSMAEGSVVQPKDMNQTPLLCVKGRPIRGGPQMLQLSLDGKRLYVTTSLYTSWDKQFYPQIALGGAMMLRVDVNTDTGGLTLNQDFLVDFGRQPNGPVLAHEMRYPGGDSTSDIWC